MNYIIIYLEVKHLLNFLTKEDKGNLLDALIEYGESKQLPECNQNVLNVFNYLKPKLDAQRDKMELKAKIARENGAAGGRPKAGEKPKKTKSKPKETKQVIQSEKRSQLEKDFEEFWESYMPIVTNDGKKIDKGSKKLARISYSKARKLYDAETIYNGTAQYLADCYRNNRLSCQVSVCLNQERFLNDFNAPTLQVKTTQRYD